MVQQDLKWRQSTGYVTKTQIKFQSVGDNLRQVRTQKVGWKNRSCDIFWNRVIIRIRPPSPQDGMCEVVSQRGNKTPIMRLALSPRGERKTEGGDESVSHFHTSVGLRGEGERERGRKDQ